MRIGNITYTLKPDEKAVYKDGAWKIIKKEAKPHEEYIKRRIKKRMRNKHKMVVRHSYKPATWKEALKEYVSRQKEQEKETKKRLQIKD